MLAGCGGGSGGSGFAPATVSIPRSMARPPETTDPAQPRWFQIIYAPTLTSQTPMVLNVEGAALLGGSQVILWPQQQSAANELWKFTKCCTSGNTVYGYYTSGLGDYPYNPYTSINNPAQSLVLSSNTGSGVVFPSQYGTKGYTKEGGYDTFQKWSYENSCSGNSCSPVAIINQLNRSSTSLYASSSGQGTPVKLRTGAPNQWAYWPPRNLQPVLDGANVPYQQFTGDQLTQYNYISCNLVPTNCTAGVPGENYSCRFHDEGDQSLNGIRCEYINLSAPLSIYVSLILNMKPASGSTPAQQTDFDDVSKQLVAELTDADAVQKLYRNYNSFYNSLFINNEALLNQMISDAQISSGASVSGRTIDIIEGVLYTLIQGAAGFATGGLAVGVAAIGNITEAAVNSAVAMGNLSESPFSVDVSDLWKDAISKDFEAILSAGGDNESKILEDSARAAAVGALISSTGPDSLAWSPLETPVLVKALKPGFEVAAMKMLLPVLYWVFPIPQAGSSDPVGDVTKNAFGSPPAYDTLTVGLGYGVWDGFAIGTGHPLGAARQEYPGQQAITNDVFGNGVSPLQFFSNLNGWKFPLWWNDYDGPPLNVPSATGCNQLIVSITNQTADDLTLSFEYEHGGGLLGSGNAKDPTSRELPPYATDVVGLLGDAGRGPDFKFCVSNGSPGDCQAVNYAQFEVQQDLCFATHGDIHYTKIAERVYKDTELDQTLGSHSNSVPGIERIAVYNPSASQ